MTATMAGRFPLASFKCQARLADIIASERLTRYCTMRRLLLASLLIFLTLSGLALGAQEPAPPRIHYFGTIATDIPALMIRRIEPLAKYLSAKLGMDIRPRPSPNMGAAIDDLGSGQTQIAYLTPVAYLDARERFQVIPIALPLTQGKISFNLAVVTHKDSPIRTIADLRGRSFAFGDEKSLFQRATLEMEGIKLEQLSRFAYIRHFDNVAKAVLNRDFDAGIMKESLALAYREKGLRVIHVSPPLPTYVIAVSPLFPEEKRAALREALLALKPIAGQGLEIMTALDPGYTRFAPANDRDFDNARIMLAPYRK